MSSFSSPLTKRDTALAGLIRNKSAPGLEIVPVEGKGYGVIATKSISEGQYVTDYKYNTIHNSRKQLKREEKDYIKNGEGSYILEAYVEGKKKYLDATRMFESFGRYYNLYVHTM